MTFSTEYEASLFKRKPSDNERFTQWTGHLPIRNDETPYHSGPHSIRAMELAWKLTGKPKKVVEFGFCLGHSASIWFGLGATHVTSIEPSLRAQTIEAIGKMKIKHGDKFQLLLPHSMTLTGPYDMAYIDGAHELADVKKDIELAVGAKCPWLVFDDINAKWGPGVETAIHSSGLVIEAIFGNLAVCRAPSNDWVSE